MFLSRVVDDLDGILSNDVKCVVPFCVDLLFGFASVLDLSNNRLDGDGEQLLEILQALPQLSVLYLQGNPIVNKIRSYRKTLISRLHKLTYLDDRPVFEGDRLCCEAWASGGVDSERAERRRQIEEKEAAQERQHQYMKRLIEKKNPIPKHEACAGIDFKHAVDDAGLLSDPDEEEPEELIAARERLALYSARPGEEEPLELSAARSKVPCCETAIMWTPLISKEDCMEPADNHVPDEAVEFFVPLHSSVDSSGNKHATTMETFSLQQTGSDMSRTDEDLQELD
eukprot:CAMPEP_0114240156 /NCGR_PEP_ID=MMETSP0058-20121206/8883_1 /TAXON_ID=36894 /ORGANISM="Pyramimonas parkeae, CCMP726" /LENGTH=283 /DNA_ID=CAMNT_0001352465 /DNA_START=944 /DNA_END=1795 /DNA_ORIENTATION=+